MNIVSIEIKNVYRAKTTHLTGVKQLNAHKKVDDIFNAITYFLSHGQRDVSYDELAEISCHSITTVKYYVSKLIKCRAIKISTHLSA